MEMYGGAGSTFFFFSFLFTFFLLTSFFYNKLNQGLSFYVEHESGLVWETASARGIHCEITSRHLSY